MQDCKEHDILTIMTTVGSLADAQRLARAVVEQRLAACVQIEPGLTSIYRWQGRVCEEPEVRLVIKTTPEQRAPLETFLGQHHPYEVPQFLGAAEQASAGYAQWVREQVGQPP
jgi:periplasmic divalent cation tolerance protein